MQHHKVFGPIVKYEKKNPCIFIAALAHSALCRRWYAKESWSNYSLCERPRLTSFKYFIRSTEFDKNFENIYWNFLPLQREKKVTVLWHKFRNVIEIINKKARHNLMDAKCRWRTDWLVGAGSFMEQNKRDANPLGGDTKPPGDPWSLLFSSSI